MRKQLLQKFVNKHPNNYLTPYFQQLIDSDLVEFNTVRDTILLAKKESKLTLSCIQQTDILEANMSLVKD